MLTKEDVRKEARKRIVKLMEEHNNSPTRVSKVLFGPDGANINKGLVSRVYNGGYSEYVAISLGLPVVKTEEVEICLTCGELHEIKRSCRSNLGYYKYRRRKAIDLDPTEYGELQSQALDTMAREQGHKTFADWMIYIADKKIALDQNLNP